jgi:hypothetical protein
MTSIAVTASMCASAAEVALLVASFMPVLSLNLGATIRGAGRRARNVRFFYSEHPASSIRLYESPLGDVDCASLEQYCGGNLTPAWPPADSVLSK